MEQVKSTVLRLLAIVGLAAATGVVARGVDPVAGGELSRMIGWGVALLSLGVMVVVVRTANHAFSVVDGAPAPSPEEVKALSQKRLIACTVVCYVVGAPVAIGLFLAGVLPWIGAALYAAPFAVALAVAVAQKRRA